MPERPAAFRVEGPTGIFQLSGPPAWGIPMIAAINQALARFEDSGAKFLLISSILPGIFSAGEDSKEKIGTSGFIEVSAARRHRLAGLDRSSSTAVIEGQALGRGLDTTLACSMRIGSDDAKLGLTQVRRQRTYRRSGKGFPALCERIPCQQTTIHQQRG